MQVYRSLDTLPASLRHGALAIGNFDGVHKGHARIMERLIAAAQSVGGPAIVFTFDPHPVRLLRPDEAPPPLTWTERKAELLGELGVDAMIAYPTDEALLSLEPETFFDQIVRQQLSARAMVEGTNFYFGRQRRGTVERLRELCQQSEITLEVVPPLMIDGQVVSSSRTREAVRQGNVRQAAELLTRPYRIRGMVTHGAKRGARIGFPTANLEAIDTLMPALGVYAGRAFTPAGGDPQQPLPAAIHIGPNPTFGERAVKFEVHLIDYQGALYGQPLEVDFIDHLRDIEPFSSVEALQSQLARDVAAARTLVETN